MTSREQVSTTEPKVSCAMMAVPQRFRAALGAVIAVALLPAMPVGRAAAAQLACPPQQEALVSAADFKGLANAGTADLANQIYASINKMQAANPSIGYSAMTDALLGAYCNAVSESAVPAGEQLAWMRRFDRIVQAQVAASMMPNGTVILASVPLAPAVFEALRKQASTVGKTPAQLMSEILSAASGR